MPSPTTTSASQRTTADELLALGPDFHGELVKGRLVEMAPASWGHGRRGNRTAKLITQHVDDHRLGVVFGSETGFYLARNPDTVRAPDVAFVRAERIPKDADGSGFFDGPPDLAVEILSPNDRLTDIADKINDYLTAGAMEVWIIDPRQRSITLHTAGASPRVLHEGEALTASLALPGFDEPVAAFFA